MLPNEYTTTNYDKPYDPKVLSAFISTSGYSKSSPLYGAYKTMLSFLQEKEESSENVTDIDKLPSGLKDLFEAAMHCKIPFVIYFKSPYTDRTAIRISFIYDTNELSNLVEELAEFNPTRYAGTSLENNPMSNTVRRVINLARNQEFEVTDQLVSFFESNNYQVFSSSLVNTESIALTFKYTK